MPLISPLAALQAIFALNAFGFALWIPRIPDVKAALGLDVLTLALCLFALPAGMLSGFLLVPAVIARIGLRRASAIAGTGFLIVFITPAFAGSAPMLAALLFLSGLFVGLIEVAMNATGSALERAGGRRLMTRCHAWWSFGSVTGALLAGHIAEAGTDFALQQSVILPVAAAATLWAAWALPAWLDDSPPGGAAEAGPAARGGWLPGPALALLCVMPGAALMIEGVMMEWSALLLRGARDFGAAEAGYAYAAFAGAMGLSRLWGDRLAERLGARVVLAVSGIILGASLIGFAAAETLGAALLLAALTGVGCANIYPLSMSLAGQLPGQRPERAIATLAMTAFSAYLLTPPIIGLLASLFGLPVAIGLMGPIAILSVLALAAERRRARRLAARPAIDQPQ